MGALVNDRQASIVVDTQATALTIPMSMRFEGVDGAPKTTWNMEVTHDKFMAPMFTAIAIGNAVETTTSVGLRTRLQSFPASPSRSRKPPFAREASAQIGMRKADTPRELSRLWKAYS